MTKVDLQTLQYALATGDVDAAIEAGLMQISVATLASLNQAGQATLMHIRQRLMTAWAARARFEARKTRLQRREQERTARRLTGTHIIPPAQSVTQTRHASTLPPALPAAVMAALARAQARAKPA